MITMALMLVALGGWVQFHAVAPRSAGAPFDAYPAHDALARVAVTPKFRSDEERQAAAVLGGAISHGWGVVDGGTEHERKGVNFGGHYTLVQWGCGSNCMQAALIDGKDGSIIRLPYAGGDDVKGFRLPTGTADLRTLEFRWNSTLLGVPRIADGTTYYYQLVGKQWHFVEKRPTPPDHD